MSATHATDSTTPASPVLYLALELSWNCWKLAFTIGAGQKPRLRSVAARDTVGLMTEIDKAKHRFALPEQAPVVSCYEAGRDGFWLDRYLRHQGVENLIVDAASIEVNRRKRRAKSDGLDAAKLVAMLVRWHRGERKLWGVVRVPTADDEDRRQLHRELIELKAQRTAHTNRIKGLLAGHGLAAHIDGEFLERLEGLRQWDGAELPGGLRGRIVREYRRWQVVGQQIHELEVERTRQIRDPQTVQGERVRQLLKLKGIGCRFRPERLQLVGPSEAHLSGCGPRRSRAMRDG